MCTLAQLCCCIVITEVALNFIMKTRVNIRVNQIHKTLSLF